MKNRISAIPFLTLALAIRASIFFLNIALLYGVYESFQDVVNAVPWRYGEYASLFLLVPSFCVVVYGVLMVMSLVQLVKSLKQEPVVKVPESLSLYALHWLAIFMSIGCAVYHKQLAEASIGAFSVLGLSEPGVRIKKAVAILCALEFIIHGKHPMLNWFDLVLGFGLSGLWCAYDLGMVDSTGDYLFGGYTFWSRENPTNILYKRTFPTVAQTLVVNAFILSSLVFAATLGLFLLSWLLSYCRIKLNISTKKERKNEEDRAHSQVVFVDTRDSVLNEV